MSSASTAANRAARLSTPLRLNPAFFFIRLSGVPSYLALEKVSLITLPQLREVSRFRKPKIPDSRGNELLTFIFSCKQEEPQGGCVARGCYQAEPNVVKINRPGSNTFSPTRLNAWLTNVSAELQDFLQQATDRVTRLVCLGRPSPTTHGSKRRAPWCCRRQLNLRVQGTRRQEPLDAKPGFQAPRDAHASCGP